MQLRLSPGTMKILKNFASINQNIVFSEGNVLRTISNSDTIFSIATIEEEIPVNAAIYDLNALLAMISCIEGADINFGDESIEISSEFGNFTMYYCSMDVVKEPNKGTPTPDILYQFDISAEDFQLLNKAAAITGAPSLTIKGDGEKVRMSVSNRKSDTSNSFKRVVGESDQIFNVFISVNNLKLIQDSYKVSIAVTKGKRKPLLYFKALNTNIEYWIACELESEV